MAALGVVILLIGGLIDIFDLCCVLISSILIFVVCEELGKGSALITYTVVAVITLLLAPSKLIAIEYLIFGYYPVLRSALESLPKVVCIILKAIYMLISAAATVLIVRFFFTTAALSPVYLEILTGAVGVLCLILCDVVFKRFSRHYHQRIRKMLRIDKFFG